MLTIDEFIKNNGMVKTRADVYSLIKLGALKTVKKGKKRYIITDNDTNIKNIEEIKEKRNRNFSFCVSEILYKKLALIGHIKKCNVIDVALKTLESIIERNCKDTNKMTLRFNKEQIMKTIELEEKIKEIEKTMKMVKTFKIDGKYIKRNFFFIFFFLMCFADILEYENFIYDKENQEKKGGVKNENHGIKT
ncbi:hypothetical protein V4D30_00855 [Thermodesulfovibrio sp. 3907-1M]|uniref:Uncharacterized protein n=1 Tax=Thermodesulfovibrio autotrophicus TaxID=3118333 RepID=A0AAU8GWJ7_9BACT